MAQKVYALELNCEGTFLLGSVQQYRSDTILCPVPKVLHAELLFFTKYSQ